jgi:polyisoprenoid-binding protein YceI
MKKNILKNTLVLVLAITLASFTSIFEKQVSIENSKVIWKGYKVTGSHQGTIALTSGVLKFESDKLIGGEFSIDMTTITNTDIEGDEYAKKLEGHLKSDDFFGVEKHPTAGIIFKTAKSSGKNSYTVNADLTIKGKTNPITFEISVYGNKASASIKVDRTLYDVRYGSTSFFDNLKDKAIYDEFDLVVDLQF